ncbi:MAG: DegT/DnrJ/EryC1/StrS aminotransferase family protein [Planctomycetota bacterium]
MHPIPHSRPLLGKREGAAVLRVLRLGHVGMGSETERLEADAARLCGVRGAVAFSSGTTAFAAGLLALRLPPRSRVLVPSMACAAFLQGCRLAGMRPVPFDVDPETCLPDPADARRRSRGARAAILFHPFGLPADPDRLPRGLEILEACGHALGTRLGARTVGSLGRFSYASLHATKPACGAEGGFLASDDGRLLARAHDLRDCDERQDPGFRFSARLADICAALARVQISRLPEFRRRRRAIARRCAEALRGTDVRLPPDRPDAPHAWYRFLAFSPRPAGEALRAFERAGIAARRPVYWPLHRILGLRGFPGAEQAWKRLVSIPIHPSLTEREIRRILSAAREAFPPARPGTL